MGYTTIFGDVCENERDEKMMRKYGDKYRCAKRIYPDIYKLPEDEIREMSSIIRYKGDTLEEAEAYLKKYIKENEDEWKKTYLTEDEPKSEENPQSDRQRPNKPGLWDYMVREFKQDGKDVLYGMDRALSGMTLGGYDWLKRKTGLGFDEKAYMAEKEKQGSDMGAKIGGVISEIGGSAIGGGAGIVKGLSNLGLKGVKLAAGAGAAEGLVTGLTSSDTLEELPENVLLNTAAGGVLGGAGDTVMNWGGKLLKPYVKELKEASPKQFQRYVSNNADKEVMEFAPREYFNELMPESNYKKVYRANKDDYAGLLKRRSTDMGIELNSDIKHLLSDERKHYVRTLKNTYDKPDMTYIQTNPAGFSQKYYVKKYFDPSNDKPFYDFLFIRDNKIFNKFHTDGDYVANQFKTPMKDLSFHGHASGNRADKLHPDIINNIAPKGAVVNPKLQNFTKMYEGVDDYQDLFLTNAITHGIKNSSHKTGSLDSMYKMNQSLEDMMNSGQFNNQALGKVKTKFDDVLNPYKADAAKAYQPFDDTRDISAGISGMWYPLWQQQMQNEE